VNATHAIVLLSGGLDSTAAALWAVQRYEVVRALAFGYGQSHRDAELAASQRTAELIGIPWTRLELADAFLYMGGVASGKVPQAGKDANGVSLANTPARNNVFIALASVRAGAWFPGKQVDVVIGSHVDDEDAFPDCRPDFVAAAGEAGRLALRGVSGFGTVSPWSGQKKSFALEYFAEDETSLSILRASVSCYAGTRCGKCDACEQRRVAFAEAGIDDGASEPVPMYGGDPSRART
jgi:7-cyano-7-deazaguanine synthase